MDYGIFSVHTDVMRAIAHWGVRTLQESLHWKLTLGENPLLHQGIEPVLVACQSNAVPTELHSHC